MERLIETRSFAIHLLIACYYESKVDWEDPESLIKKVGERPECRAMIGAQVCGGRRNARDLLKDNR
jgi:hypothetical protein